MKKVTVGAYKNCAEIKVGEFRIAVTTEEGPRVIGCFIGDDDNMFAVLPKTVFKKGYNFKLYGGHRLWLSPEDFPRSYEEDNAPVTVTELESGLEFSTPAEPNTCIRKKVTIEPLGNGMMIVTHTLTNCGMWPVEVAPWAMTMCAPGGLVVVPQYIDKEGFPYAPDRSLHLWPYSSFADPRFKLSDKYFFVKQDPNIKDSFKMGTNNEAGWVAYVRNGKAFIKYFDVLDESEGDYPDGGCSTEVFACDKFCEVETLGVLETLEPGESSQHVEYWQGISGLPEIKDEEDFDKYVLPHILIPQDSCCDDDCDCDDDDCDCGHHHH